MIDKVSGPRLGSDANEYLIAMWKALQSGWLPPDSVDEDIYQAIKAQPELFDPAFVAFVGFGCSFGGKWFGGYARGGTTATGEPVNYSAQSKRSVLRQLTALLDVRFVHSRFEDLDIPTGSLVYCDPPYAGTTNGYTTAVGGFWDRVRDLSESCDVYVSEYSAPDDFECIWEKRVNNTLAQDTGSRQGVERLFRLAS